MKSVYEIRDLKKKGQELIKLNDFYTKYIYLTSLDNLNTEIIKIKNKLVK